MAKLTRYVQKIFGASAGAGQISKFGSLAAGTPTTYSGATVTPANVQALTNFDQGWGGAVLGNGNPPRADMNALNWLVTRQLAYLMQQGVAEYDSSTTYYTGSYCQVSGVMYISLIDTNVGNTPASSPFAWSVFQRTVKTPTVQKFLSTGTATGYVFFTSPGNATVGATYTNNGQTFTVTATVSSGTWLVCTGTGSPAASGTLTKASGTGDPAFSFTAWQATATYTSPSTPAPLYLRVKAMGAGGGGGGSGSGAASGGAGNGTIFGANLVYAGGGTGSSFRSGGSASVASPAIPVYALSGGSGGLGVIASSLSGAGGNGYLGGAGSTTTTTAAVDAVTNSGAGGGGAGGSTAGVGAGGGAGGYAECLIYNPSGTYTYSVGTGGTSGTAGSGGGPGGVGGSGLLIVEEYYQ